MTWVWTHELSIDEVLRQHSVFPTPAGEPVDAPTEAIPFPGVAFELVEGRPELRFQAAITSEPRPGTIWEAMVADGVGPPGRSGGRRSGVLLYKAERVVGWRVVGFYIDPGFHGAAEWMLWVAPEHRGCGLGQELFIAWWRSFPRHTTLHPALAFNADAERCLRAAFARYVFGFTVTARGPG